MLQNVFHRASGIITSLRAIPFFIRSYAIMRKFPSLAGYSIMHHELYHCITQHNRTTVNDHEEDEDKKMEGDYAVFIITREMMTWMSVFR